MIVLKNKTLMDQNFNQACAKLERFPGFGVKTAYKITKIMKLIRQESQDVQNTFISMVKNYAQLDEKGNFVPNKTPEGQAIPNTFIIKDECEADYKKAREEFDNMDLKIDWAQLTTSEVDKLNISAAELSAIDPLIDFEADEAKAAELQDLMKKIGAN